MLGTAELITRSLAVSYECWLNLRKYSKHPIFFEGCNYMYSDIEQYCSKDIILEKIFYTKLAGICDV